MTKLATKSIQEPVSQVDGIRICIMRRIKPEFEFDMWMQPLSPSTELLKQYHDNEVSWDEFKQILTREMLEKQTKFLDIIANIAKTHDVTLLCWEETPEKCHRKLVAEWIVTKYPDLSLSLL